MSYIPFLFLPNVFDQFIEYLGGFLISRFKRYLKEATDGASLMSSGKAFQALIAERKKEL